MPIQRVLTYAFFALLVLIQYPLWLGKGGWLRVWELDRQVEAQRKTTAGLKQRNAGMEAEVRDLKNGVGAIEERARFELGMVKDDEIFFQVLDASAPTPTIGVVTPAAPDLMQTTPAPAPPAAAAAPGTPATSGARVGTAPAAR
jgi:cell division protein FtsB